MKRFLLLNIYLILSFTVVNSVPLYPDVYHETCHSSSAAEPAEATGQLRQDTTTYNFSDTLIKLFSEGYVSAPRDTLPIQIGAFSKRSNAETIFDEIKRISDIKVRIVTENGLFKVRISKLPPNTEHVQITHLALNDQDRSKDIMSAETDSISHNSVISEPFQTEPQLNQSSIIPGDTAPYANKIIFFDGDSPWLKKIKYFGESFLLVNALIITILISICTMFILLIVILLNRKRLENEAKLRQYLLEKYQNLIVDYLYGNASPDDFKAIASDNYRRQVLIDQMIDVSVNIKGEGSEKLFSLYKHLGLDKDSLARAHDRRWHKKIKGFRELAFMNIKTANRSMYKALNSSNDILRMEAQIALVRLNDENPFDFLSHLKRPFSLWEQITLHDMMIQHNIQPPSFKRWLYSPNKTVVLFALRMIREFRQHDAEEDIKTTMMHSSPVVRQMAVQVAGDLGMISTLDNMKKMYKTQDYNVCMEIVRSMGKMPDVSMLGFLKLVLDKEDDVQLQIEATKSIENMGEEGVKALVKIMKSEYKNYNIIVRHVLDRRIN